MKIGYPWQFYEEKKPTKRAEKDATELYNRLCGVLKKYGYSPARKLDLHERKK